MKGIILAGGMGSRLFPITKGVVKQLLPVYDKPMIYYPLSVLMLSGITEILIISTPRDISRFKEIFGNGKDWGLDISYKIQEKPEGIAQSFILARDFIYNDSICLILGDNIFYGNDLEKILIKSKKEVEEKNRSVIFAYEVKNSKRYGVVEFDNDNNVISIEEKPENPKSKYAVTGLYFYTNEVVKVVGNIKKSKRGEYEITDVNKIFLEKKNLSVKLLNKGFAWLDTGTYDSLLEASQFINIIEKRQGIKVACIEEIAYKKKYINKDTLKKHIKNLSKNNYGSYLSSLL
jgi:glucose-1-phosphate thymidylyltransferase